MNRPHVNLVCICKDENSYLEEWLHYHINIGFAHVYMYDNSDDQNIIIPERYISSVTVIPYRGKAVQNQAYTHYDMTYGTHNIWSMALDIDEFLVVPQGDVRLYVQQLLERNIYCVGINWKFYGSSGHVERAPGGVIERFTNAQHGIDRHIKTLYRNGYTAKRWDCPHYPQLKSTQNMYSTGGDIIQNTPFANPEEVRVDTNVFVAHYFCKSKQEWKIKQNRGRADNGQFRADHDFEAMDMNQVHDESVLNIYKNINVE